VLGKAVQALAGRRGGVKAPPSAAEKDRNTPISVPVTGSSQAACPVLARAPVPDASPCPGPSSGCSSSAGELSAAACSAARTTSAI